MSNRLLHMTKEGNIMPIAAMEDEHLQNTIKLICRPMIELQQNLARPTEGLSARARALYGDTVKVSAEKFEEVYSLWCEKISPYIMEAAMRGLLGPTVRPVDNPQGVTVNPTTKALQEAMGRHGMDTEAPKIVGRAARGVNRPGSSIRLGGMFALPGDSKGPLSGDRPLSEHFYEDIDLDIEA
jgi:hypothetical protein